MKSVILAMATAIAVAVGLGGCRGRGNEGHGTGAAIGVTQALSEAARRESGSIYALPMTLTDQDGASVGLDVFRGQPVLIGMFYASCPSACPMLVSAIKKVMAELDPAVRREVRVLLVSFDPDHDRPAVLHETFVRRGLDARYKLAAAPEDQVRDLAAVLGIQYRRLADGSFAHTSSIVLLDRSGAIDTRVDDLESSTDVLVVRAKVIGAPSVR